MKNLRDNVLAGILLCLALPVLFLLCAFSIAAMDAMLSLGSDSLPMWDIKTLFRGTKQ